MIAEYFFFDHISSFCFPNSIDYSLLLKPPDVDYTVCPQKGIAMTFLVDRPTLTFFGANFPAEICLVPGEGKHQKLNLVYEFLVKCVSPYWKRVNISEYLFESKPRRFVSNYVNTFNWKLKEQLTKFKNITSRETFRIDDKRIFNQSVSPIEDEFFIVSEIHHFM